jgi:hypothetical protein
MRVEVLSDPRVLVHYPKTLALLRWVQSRSSERARAKGRDSLVREKRYPGSMVRRLRTAGRSLVLTTPKYLVGLYDLRPGDLMQFEPFGRETLRIAMVRSEAKV